MQIIWSRNASADLDAVFQYLLPKNPKAAIEIIDQINASIEHLAQHPELGRKGRITHTRELIIPQTPYIVTYRFVENVLEIAAIIHGSRKWPNQT